VVADRERESQLSLLARRGFGDPDAVAARLISAALGELGRDPLVLDALSRCADPDLALETLARLLEASPDPETLRGTLASSMPLRARLLGVFGVSAALGDFVVRHPESWHVLEEFEVEDLTPDPAQFRALMLDAVGADAVEELPVATLTGVAAQDALRIAYRRALLAITARDVAASSDLHLKTLAAEAGVTRTGFYPKGQRPGTYQHLAEEFERRLAALRATGGIPDPRDAQIARLRTEVEELRGRVALRDALVAELTSFKNLALSRLAAQHAELERLRRRRQAQDNVVPLARRTTRPEH